MLIRELTHTKTKKQRPHIVMITSLALEYYFACEGR